MTPVPKLTCPACRGDLEYQATIEMLDPPIGKIDTGYCAKCARLFERIRQSGACEPTGWLPLCRLCRQPVSFADVQHADGRELARFECREHPQEQWLWTRVSDLWTRVSQ